MRRKIEVSVHRFGRRFELVYYAGPTPEQSDPSAVVKVDGESIGIATIIYHEPEWNEVNVMDLPDQYQLLSPSDLGINTVTEDLTDHRFMTDAEEYILTLLNEELARKLTARNVEEPPTEEQSDEALMLTPLDRGKRVVDVWHNHGGKIEQLPDLVAIEIYDAVEHVGHALGDMLDESDIEREACGEFVRGIVSEALISWKKVEEAD
jgi:hypothetical protein